jgi:hypothetical protein
MATYDLATWIDRILPQLEPVYWENMKTLVSQEEFSWIGKIFNVKPGTKMREEWSTTERGRALQAGTETSAYPIRPLPTMNDATVDMVVYRDSFPVSEIMVKYGGPPDVHVFPRLEEWVADLARGALLSQAERASSLLLDGFTGALQLCPDSRPLFYTAHTHMTGAATYTNHSVYELDYNGLGDAWDKNSQMELVDSHNHPLDINFDRIVVGKKYKRVARKLFLDSVKPGGTNDEANEFQGLISEDNIIVCPYFNEKIKAGSSKYWILLDSLRHGLTGTILEGLQMKREQIPGTDQFQIQARSIFEMYFKGWEGTLGSTGASKLT